MKKEQPEFRSKQQLIGTLAIRGLAFLSNTLFLQLPFRVSLLALAPRGLGKLTLSILTLGTFKTHQLKKQNIEILILSIAALLAGFIIAKMDTSKNWDYTGITVFSILSVTLVLSVFRRVKPWLLAILVASPQSLFFISPFPALKS